MIESVRIRNRAGKTIIGFDTSRGYFSVTTDGTKVRPELGEPLRFASFTSKEADEIERMALCLHHIAYADKHAII